MEIGTVHGLDTASINVAEAAGVDWSEMRAKVDIVRIVDPEPASWWALRQAGFAIIPECVTWTAPIGESGEAFVARLSANERRNIRKGARFLTTLGIRLEVTAPLDAPSFDAFLGLYVPQVEAMRHGVPFALHQRSEILDQRADYVMVQALRDDTLLGCCVCLVHGDPPTILVRFTATSQEGRESRVVRAMYLRAFEVARERGCGSVSLGTDPALYGHIAKPGLFRFKSRLGFTPVPGRIFGSFDDPDEAWRVLSLDALNDPSLLLSYQLPDSDIPVEITAETRLRLDVLTRGSGIDFDPYRAPFLADIGIKKIS